MCYVENNFLIKKLVWQRRTICKDLLKDYGHFYSYSEFIATYEVNTTSRVFEWVTKSVSQKFLYFIRKCGSYKVSKCEVPK